MFRSVIALALLAVPLVLASNSKEESDLYCFWPLISPLNPGYSWEVDFARTKRICDTLGSGTYDIENYNTCRVKPHDVKAFKERCEEVGSFKAGSTTVPTLWRVWSTWHYGNRDANIGIWVSRSFCSLRISDIKFCWMLYWSITYILCVCCC